MNDIQPGRFYVQLDGHVWCCFKYVKGALGTYAMCVNLRYANVESFHLNGKSTSGQLSSELIREVPVLELTHPMGHTRDKL